MDRRAAVRVVEQIMRSHPELEATGYERTPLPNGRGYKWSVMAINPEDGSRYKFSSLGQFLLYQEGRLHGYSTYPAEGRE